MSATSSTESSQRSAALNQKLRLVQQRLAPESAGRAALAEAQPPASELGELLFSRAPDDFLKRSSVGALVEIARDAAAFYRDFAQSNKPFQVLVTNPPATSERAPYTAVFTAVGNRPFVVDSIAEFFRVGRLTHHVLLHPLVQQPNRCDSLTYSEIDRVEDPADLAALTAEIEKILELLILVTADFDQMLGRNREYIDRLRSVPSTDRTRFDSNAEIGEFLHWLAEGGFIFLGCREWSLAGGKLERRARDLGFYRSADPFLAQSFQETSRDAETLAAGALSFTASKILVESPIHRRAYVDLITVRVPGERASESAIVEFLGLLTSKAHPQQAAAIPVVRRKLASLLEGEGFLPNSHDFKETNALMNAMPKIDLMQADLDTLRANLRLLIGLQRRTETRASLRLHSLSRFAAVLCLIPQERFSAEMVQEVEATLADRFGCSSRIECHIAMVEEQAVIVRFLIPNPSFQAPAVDEKEIETIIAEAASSWDDKVTSVLAAGSGRSTAARLMSFYQRALPEQYKATVSPEDAASDIRTLELLSSENPFELSFRELPGEAAARRSYELRIVRRSGDLTLSSIVPLLENCGFDAASETVTPISATRKTWAAIYSLTVLPKSDTAVTAERAAEVLLPGLRRLFAGTAENDRLNALLVNPGLSITDIAVLRTLGRYLWQIRGATSETLISTALIDNPAAARLLAQMFDVKFNPASAASGASRLEQLREEFRDTLKQVSLLAHDRILQSLANIIEAAVRTNVYQASSREQLRIAIKIECRRIDKMPDPRPLFEIFVCSPELEGVHLRGGKVARGGIRWSERPEDFRTEVLGLMKTQMVKNAIIVPVGAKGGFVLKNRAETPAKVKEQVEGCYRLFIRSLLEVTDNLDGATVKHPPHVVLYDSDDPYFVVAADKGTATFSDIANQIAVREFDFWLGDAFASGGSAGYSHKAYGITARGAWECTLDYFRSHGLDPDRDTFTVAGIGDMSGDVFGNGLLRSRHALLVAAFDHRHIFLDPHPDPEAAFAERQRLFQLPASSWKDYDQRLISAGGGVFPRSQKEIPVSKEAAAALGIESGSLAAIELIRAILKAPVDLLWNGGIGTYVKASSETNQSVSDRANDDVRVDAAELRAKLVTEGGNLGFTQLARIEYAEAGGHINTDAIDNSAGVDLSDIEVNLKILLREPVRRAELTASERLNLLLAEAEGICERIVSHNRAQSKIISRGEIRSRENMLYFRKLIEKYEREGVLSRKLECLPDAATLGNRVQQHQGLYRPELAVLLAYTKITATDLILESDVPDSPSAERYLINYFPAAIASRFAEDVVNHPLRREIIATQIANAMVDRMGITHLIRTAEEAGASEIDVVRAYLAAEEIVGAPALLRALADLERTGNAEACRTAEMEIAVAIRSAALWILERGEQTAPIEQISGRYREAFCLLTALGESFVPPHLKQAHQKVAAMLKAQDFPAELTQIAACAPFSSLVLDIAAAATEHTLPLVDAARVYGDVAAQLRIYRLLERSSSLNLSDVYEISAVHVLTSQIRRSVGRIASLALALGDEAGTLADTNPNPEVRAAFLRYRHSAEDAESRPMSVALLLTLSQQLQSLLAALQVRMETVARG